MKVDILIKNACLLTMDMDRGIIDRGALAIKGSRIAAVGETREIEDKYQADKIIDCKGNAVLPGLIDAHGHGGHSLLKTIAGDTPTIWEQILTDVYFNYTTEEFWYKEGRLSALERLKFGITTGLSVLGSQPRCDKPVFACQHARAYQEVGIREIVAVGPCNPPWPRKFSYWEKGRRKTELVSFEQTMNSLEEVIQRVNGKADGRLRVYVTPYLIVASLDSKGPTPPESAFLTEYDQLMSRSIRQVAEKYSTRIHSDAFGGMVKLASRDPYGLLGPDVSLHHCRGLSLEEVRILAETDTRVSHTPGAGQATAHCPVPELMDAGVKVAIATDGTSPHAPFDLFQVMRKAQLIQQMRFRDSYYLPPGKLLAMVTIDAARVLGWDDELGSLEPGKKADIIMINMDQPHLKPNFMTAHRLVYEASGHDVDTVIVDGNIVMEGRRVLTVDEKDIMKQAQEEAEETVRRANLSSHMNTPPGFWSKSRMDSELRIKRKS